MSKLFSGLCADELQFLENIAQTKTFLPGEAVFKEGDPGDGMYVVVQGQVRISAVIGQEQPRVLSHFKPGDFFGEMALLDNEPRSASAIADEETQLLFIPRLGLLNLLERSPKMAFSLVREFSLRLREFNRQYIREVLQSERLALVGRFARSIVHDFKNPLAIIGLAADISATEEATFEMRHVAKERIRKQVDRLSDMINELLEFTRGSQITMVPALTDYPAFVTQLLNDIRDETETHSVSLVCENPPPAVRLLLYPDRLTQVFYNLAHNAVDAMPGGGTITFRFANDGKTVITEVEDTGPGIDPHIAERLFEPFATYGKAHGTGLGLSICQRIIRDHGGQITTRSERGRGAIFTFSLPIHVSS